uniref:Phospholipase B1 n=1 Tax=Crocodylus porosus TaxID=8502 RepID=A0A7M4ETK3_CROPO
IKVIAALGDSLTAGSGAAAKPNDVLDVLTQYRGLSWSIGGNENISTVTTLPNILREFNPSLQGYSTGSGGPNSLNAFLNQAVVGDRAEDVPAQVRKLVDLMKNDRINFQGDWKLITLFIGGNDLCKFCNDPINFSPENFTRNIQTALDMLHKEVPRTFVNLVTVLHIMTLRELYQEASINCPRKLMRSLCPCLLTYDANSTEIEMLASFNRRYQEGTHQLIESGRYDTKEDFTVVVQPFLEKVTMPKTKEGLPDDSFFAPDCFHFHQKTHSQAARALWNNMVRPWKAHQSLSCPLPAKHNELNCISCLTVHALKPADVRVIAALGDSLTVRNFVFLLLISLVDQYHILIAQVELNIFREFNVNLTGYSTGIGNASEPNAFLNQAIPGAEAKELPSQARTLVRLMKNDPRINFNVDWKIITVLIGANDLCNYCKDPESVQVLTESGRYDTHENFTVVVQPFFRNTKIPLLQDGRPDLSYFAPDCFHLNQKSHSQLSRVLWNTMVGWHTFVHNLKCSSASMAQNTFATFPLCNIFHELRPVDIKVIAALGDSLTVSISISKGLSILFSSLQDILKKFNPNIFGFSTGTKKEMAGFNIAAAGARALNMSTQARTLVELMRNSLKMNFKLDWKLITIFIGGNDLCQYCLDQVSACKLGTQLWVLGKRTKSVYVCPCVLNPQENSPELQEMRRINRDFQMSCAESQMHELLCFFFFLLQARKPDLSFFAVDCFHFAERGYAEMAMALWNNMLEPVGRKQSYNNFTYNRMKLKCPSLENPFLYTSRNSGLQSTVPSPEEIAVPYWAVIVAAAAGVLVGSLLVWAVLVRRSKKQQKRRQIATEMKSTFL